MAKKPASPNPDAGQLAGTIEQAAEAYDKAIAPASFKDPEPVEGVDFKRVTPSMTPDRGPNAFDFPPSREEFDALKARVDALAEVHRQNTGKVI